MTYEAALRRPREPGGFAPRPGEDGRVDQEQVALTAGDCLATIPGVTAVTWASNVPLGGVFHHKVPARCATS